MVKKEKAIMLINENIDNLIDLQDDGYGCNDISMMLDKLNSIRGDIEEGILPLQLSN